MNVMLDISLTILAEIVYKKTTWKLLSTEHMCIWSNVQNAATSHTVVTSGPPATLALLGSLPLYCLRHKIPFLSSSLSQVP